VRRHFRSILGAILFLPTILPWVGRCLEYLEHIEFIANHVGYLKAVGAMILEPPPWINIPLIVAGLALIWWDRRRKSPEKSADHKNLLLDAAPDGGKNLPREALALTPAQKERKRDALASVHKVLSTLRDRSVFSVSEDKLRQEFNQGGAPRLLAYLRATEKDAREIRVAIATELERHILNFPHIKAFLKLTEGLSVANLNSELLNVDRFIIRKLGEYQSDGERKVFLAESKVVRDWAEIHRRTTIWIRQAQSLIEQTIRELDKQ
jgi:hypothetical protein